MQERICVYTSGLMPSLAGVGASARRWLRALGRCMLLVLAARIAYLLSSHVESLLGCWAAEKESTPRRTADRKDSDWMHTM
jgi:hypothetical protein